MSSKSRSAGAGRVPNWVPRCASSRGKGSGSEAMGSDPGHESDVVPCHSRAIDSQSIVRFGRACAKVPEVRIIRAWALRLSEVVDAHEYGAGGGPAKRDGVRGWEA